MVIDYFILKRNRAVLEETRPSGKLPQKVERSGTPSRLPCGRSRCMGEGSSILAIGFRAELLIFAGIVYWGRYRHYKSVKKVDVVKFKETE